MRIMKIEDYDGLVDALDELLDAAYGQGVRQHGLDVRSPDIEAVIDKYVDVIDIDD